MTQIIDLFRNIKYGIKNFWKYKSIIWYDRDWDYCFLLELVQFKLEQMSELQYKYGNSVYADKIGDELKRTAGLIKLLKNGNFFKNHDELDKKYGEFIFSEKTFKRENEHLFSEEEYSRDFKNALEEDAKDLKFIERKLFKLLKNYKTWWD